MLGALFACSACGPAKPAVPIEKTTFAAALGVDLAASTKLSNGEYVRDLAQGTGVSPVSIGQQLSVRYSGWLPDGTLFDSNESAGKAAFGFRYGVGQVIKGWDEGLDGLKPGGQRQLIIPPALGYGEDGYPPVIPSNSILVFNVTLE